MRIFADNPHPVAYLRITVGFIARLLVLSQHKAPIESPDTMVLSYITVLKGEKKGKTLKLCPWPPRKKKSPAFSTTLEFWCKQGV